MKEQAAQSFSSGSASTNPNGKLYEKLPSQHQDVRGWFELENREMHLTEFNSNFTNNAVTAMAYYENGVNNTPNPIGNYENSVIPDENVSYGSFEEAAFHSMSSLDWQINNRQWTFQDGDELQSMAFSYINQHS